MPRQRMCQCVVNGVHCEDGCSIVNRYDSSGEKRLHCSRARMRGTVTHVCGIFVVRILTKVMQTRKVNIVREGGWSWQRVNMKCMYSYTHTYIVPMKRFIS